MVYTSNIYVTDENGKHVKMPLGKWYDNLDDCYEESNIVAKTKYEGVWFAINLVVKEREELI